MKHGHGLLVLLPDARVSGVWRQLAIRLADARCEVKAVVPTELPPAVVARLYRHNLGRTEEGRVDGTWLGRATFGLDQCVVLILKSSSVEDLSGALAAWKGSSAPAGRGPGALRSVAAFANRCMSLLHTPDNADDAADDAALVLGAELRDAIIGADSDRPLPWEAITALVERVTPDVGLTPGAFLSTVLAKAALTLGLDARLTPISTDDGPLVDVGLRMSNQDPAARGALRHLPDPQLRVVPADPWEAVQARHHLRMRGSLKDVIELVSLGVTGGMFAEYAERELTRNGVINEKWERHMLLTTLTFPVPHEDLP